MKRKLLVAGVVTLIIATACVAQVSTMFHISVVTPSGAEGVLDWTQGWMQAKGFAVPPQNARTEAQGKLLARRGAIIDAQRSLVEMLEGVNLVGSSTLLNYEPNDVVRTNVLTTSLLTFAQIVPGSEKWVIEEGKDWTEGYYELMLQYNLSGLVLTTLPYVLPATTAGSLPSSPSTVPEYTGLVIDARGLSITPATFIGLYGMNGNAYAETVAPLYVPSASYVLSGTGESVEISRDDPRVGNNPLVIRALAVNEQGTGLIIGSEEGCIVEQLAAATDILIRGGGSVLVVAD